MHFGIRMLQVCLRGVRSVPLGIRILQLFLLGVRSLRDSRHGGMNFDIRMLQVCLRGVSSLCDSRYDRMHLG